MKYKIGDYVKIMDCTIGSGAATFIGYIGKIKYVSNNRTVPFYQIDDIDAIWEERELTKPTQEEIILAVL